MATATLGITRNLDELGRIVIPKEYRDALRIKADTEVEIVRVGNSIRIRAAGSPCESCHGTGIK